MTKLVWEDRRYEAGISKGVFYPIAGPGVPWNGLVSVNESVVGGERSDHHLDGVKFLEFFSGSDFQATIEAYAPPQGFGPYSGEIGLVKGFLLTRQPKKRFNLSYQTGTSDGYRTHLVYNAIASPSSRTSKSKNSSADPSILEWTLDATPVYVPGFRPTAHFVIDSTRAPADNVLELENFLYGTDELDPTCPTIAQLLGIFAP